jgi:hypothetical protein
LCVERVGGDAGEDFGEGVLDGGAVLERGECEDGVVGVDVKVFGRAPGGLVVVVELLAAQGGRAAAMAVDVDVAAEEALAGFPWFITSECGGGQPPYLSLKVFLLQGLRWSWYGQVG